MIRERYERDGEVLHQLMPDLHESAEVSHVIDYLRANGQTEAEQPGQMLGAYLEFLKDRDYGNDGIIPSDYVGGNPDSLQRQVDYAHPIDPSLVPEAYYDRVAEQARKSGHEHHLPFSDERRKQLGRRLRLKQQLELGEWARHISWADQTGPHMAVYAWEAVKQLGEFDPQTGEIHERTADSAEGYPVYDHVAFTGAIKEIRDRALTRVNGQAGEELAPEDIDFKTVYARHLAQYEEPAERPSPRIKSPLVKPEDLLTMNIIEAKLAGYPGADLSKQEVKVLYGIDIDEEGMPRMKYELPSIRATRAEMDMPALREIVREKIREQVAISYQAYQEVALQLAGTRGGAEIASLEEVTQIIEAKIAEWEENGVLDYAAKKLIDEELPHVLTITPNVAVSDSEFPDIEKKFYPHDKPYGKGLERITWLNRMKFKMNQFDFFGKGMYDEQPDGSGLPVRVSLVSAKPYADLRHRMTVLGQQKKVAKMQAEQPNLNFRSPSILEAIVWARNMNLNPSMRRYEELGHSPQTRHIDLPQVEQEVMKNVDLMGMAMASFASALTGKSKRGATTHIETEMQNCIPSTVAYLGGVSLSRSPVKRSGDIHLAIG